MAPHWQDVTPLFMECELALRYRDRILFVNLFVNATPESLELPRFTVVTLDNAGLPCPDSPELYAGPSWNAACEALMRVHVSDKTVTQQTSDYIQRLKWAMVGKPVNRANHTAMLGLTRMVMASEAEIASGLSPNPWTVEHIMQRACDLELPAPR